MNKMRVIGNIIVLLMVITISKSEDTNGNEIDKMRSERQARQLSFWPSSSGLSRQIYDMLDIVTDVAMLTLLGIPILGLVALSASMFGPGIGSAAAGRKKRNTDDEHIFGRTKRAILYARNLFDILANLEDTFQKYDIKESECQLRSICEVYKSGKLLKSEYKSFGENVIDLIKMEKDLEEYEIIPLAKIIFGQYSDAATYGLEDNDCKLVYSKCSHSLDELMAPNKKLAHENESH